MVVQIMAPGNRTDVKHAFPGGDRVWLRLIQWPLSLMKPRILSKIHEHATNKLIGATVGIGLTPMVIKQQPAETTIAKIVQAVRFAKKIGGTVIVLTGHTGSGILGPEVIKRCQSDPELCPLTITTGNGYTANAMVGSVLTTVADQHLKSDRLSLAIIGCYGSIGSAVTHSLLSTVDWHQIRLIGNKAKPTESFKNRVVAKYGLDEATVFAETDVENLHLADVIITATTNTKAFIDSHHLKEGAIICDAAVPPAIFDQTIRDRQDLCYFIGGAVKPITPGGHGLDFGFDFGLPPGFCYACMAEGFILDWSGHHELATKTTGISLSKSTELGKLAAIYQFRSERRFRHSHRFSKTQAFLQWINRRKAITG